MNDCTLLTECLCCASTDIETILDMGSQPLANNYNDFQNLKFPIGLNKCNNCLHLQITHLVDPKILFNEYSYYSGISNTFKEYCNWFANFLNNTFPNNKLILDIGCNDGTQLDYFKQLGFTTVGVDPAKNIYPISSKNHDVYCGFFNENFANSLKNEYDRFDFIICQNAFAHNANHFKMLSDIKLLMTDNTKLIIQTSQSDMLLHGQFDTIYHEHVSFFNINSMKYLCDRCGLFLTDVIKVDIHGTSYIFIIELKNKNPEEINYLISQESYIFDENTYTDFINKSCSIINKIRIELYKYRLLNYPIIGYGAAAKGNVFINYANIKLDFIIDDTPQKQNKFTPGLNIPIVSSDKLLEIDQDVIFVILPWNFYDEIINKIKTLRANHHDKFIKYYPDFGIE